MTAALKKPKRHSKTPLLLYFHSAPPFPLVSRRIGERYVRNPGTVDVPLERLRSGQSSRLPWRPTLIYPAIVRNNMGASRIPW